MRTRFKSSLVVLAFSVAIAGFVGRPADAAVDETSAAVKYGWGTALPGSDEFNYSGTPDSNKWGIYGEGGDEAGPEST